MAIPSNLYAEKIFSEHPIALWSLDEKVDYLSLLTQEDRDFSNWTKSSNAISLSDAVRIDEPFPSAPITEVRVNSESITEIVLTGESLFSSLSLNQDLKTFSIGCYFYSDSPSITGVSVGYTYDGLPEPVFKNVKTQVANRWFFISDIFDIPDTNKDISIIVKIRYSIIPEISEYVFYLNGVTAGQWAENFAPSSLGVDDLQTLSNNIFGISENDFLFIPAKAYGLTTLNGYYLVKDNKFLARNTSIPMVYGAENITTLSPNNNLPSLLIPGLGFLNEAGRYKEYTAEFWIRINSNSTEKRKIFGPVASADGLYVDGPFLTLQIGQYSGSHFIGEWFRPMLIDIRFIAGAASLMINGERVISFEIDNAILNLAQFTSNNNEEQDWLGFYAYDDISPINIDCIAIYPYAVPEVVAKRRFVYGQGVEYPENINTAYNGTSVYIDYQFANYANNYSYPDIGRWKQGVAENITTENNILKLPQYPLPKLITSNNSSEQLINNQENDYFTFYPNTNWEDINSYFVFESLEFLKTRPECIYGIFEIESFSEQRQDIFTIIDPITNNYFVAYIQNNQILYQLLYNGNLQSIAVDNYDNEIFENIKFRIGIVFKDFALKFGKTAALFFNNISRYQIYLGGNKELQNTFNGKMYNFGFANERNLQNIKQLFNVSGIMNNYESVFDDYFNEESIEAEYDGGLPNTESWSIQLNSSNAYNPSSFKEVNLYSEISTYVLSPKVRSGEFKLDIASSGYWQDYVPLSYFAKYVTNTKGDRVYALDFIQANVTYPTPEKFIKINGINYYNTSKSILKSYVAFHDNASKTIGAKENRFKVSLSETKVVNPTANWRSEKYEIIDGSIIYMPENINFNTVSMSIHFEIKSDAILSKPVKIKQLHLGSLALSTSVPTKIGTKFGSEMYPYRKNGVYYTDYKKNNPFEIYKGSSPYLYLTKKSGIRLINNDSSYQDRGIEIPINGGLSSSFKMIAFQSSVLYIKEKFPMDPVKIFEIRSNNSLTKIYLVSSQEDGQRGKIYAINGYTGGSEKGITFYVNGKPSITPSININEWAVLGINFGNLLDFANNLGKIRISGPLLVNNLSYYQLDDLQIIKKPVNRLWTEVRSASGEDLTWTSWDPEKDLDSGAFYQGKNWGEVLIISAENQYEINGQDIYNSFAGTNKIIIDDTQIDRDVYNTNTFNLTGYEYNVITGALLESKTLKAV